MNVILDLVMTLLYKALIKTMLLITTDGVRHAQSLRLNVSSVIKTKDVLLVSNSLETLLDIGGLLQELEMDGVFAIKWTVLSELTCKKLEAFTTMIQQDR